MEFDLVTREHIIQGIKDFEEKGFPEGFGPSSTYDIIHEGKAYPPKAIMVYANFHAKGRKIERYFSGGIGTDCFKAFERNGFIIKKKGNNMHEKLYKLKQEFLKTWPIEKLEVMTLEEYTNLNKTSFCYWLEHITRDLGSIVGGSSYKFGIYKRNDKSEVKEESNRTTDGEYAWFKKYGEDSKEQAFETIRSIIINIARLAQSDRLEEIDGIDLGNAYKWKIAFLYGDFNCLNAFKLDALRVIASNLDIVYTNKTSISKFHRAILNLKPTDQEYFSWSHELWRQYETRLIDVRKDFAKWLNTNTYDSYRAYLGSTDKSIEARLDEINSFFDDVDFFLVDPNKIDDLISTILFMMSKKERAKNPDFVEYDSKNSNGIPKAILGKNNYLKFLKEKFDYQEPNYWIFQGNPNIYNITNALKAAHLKSWKVAAHKDKIKIGDQVILWQTGKTPGCYALAEVTSEVGAFKEEAFEKKYYLNQVESIATDRVKIKITKYLADNPILWNDIKDNPVFSNFNAGNQGTNFTATQEQFNTLLYWNLSKNTKYWLFAPGENASAWDEFYNSGIMALGWDDIGDLSQYRIREDIRDALRNAYGGEGDKKNDVSANDDFANKMSVNDIVIVKKGRRELLGYGVVLSDYYYDEKRSEYKSCRRVDWKLRGNWKTDHNLVLKTLTDITQYDTELEEYDKYHERLMAIMDSKLIKASTDMSNIKSINRILYGPPGTGKTYYLKDQLFEKYTSKETSITKEQHFETVVSGCSWWQVIAIALLDLGNAKVSDIFEHDWVQKKASLSNSKTIRPTLWGQLQSHTINECEYVNVTNRQQPLIFNKTGDSYWEILEDHVEELAPELYDLKDSVTNYNPDPDKIIKHYDFVTFHQSFAYEDFIEGIKPILPQDDAEDTKDLGYRIEDGVFKKLCQRAQNDSENRYAIFIDEINRGNVSAIFGELITLIETDKRKDAKNELSIKLPYSKKEFSVPSNIDIYGTMNTADRSVEALDTALRRRFEFKEMMPDYELIVKERVGDIKLSEVLKIINQRIELLIDRDHTIGHSYFVNVNTTKAMADAFNNKIVPLLQEYFYGDYGKIGLVLGKGFVVKVKNENITFAKFEYENANDFKTPTFVLKRVDENTVLEAVRLLIGDLNNKEEN